MSSWRSAGYSSWDPQRHVVDFGSEIPSERTGTPGGIYVRRRHLWKKWVIHHRRRFIIQMIRANPPLLVPAARGQSSNFHCTDVGVWSKLSRQQRLPMVISQTERLTGSRWRLGTRQRETRTSNIRRALFDLWLHSLWSIGCPTTANNDPLHCRCVNQRDRHRPAGWLAGPWV